MCDGRACNTCAVSMHCAAGKLSKAQAALEKLHSQLQLAGQPHGFLLTQLAAAEAAASQAQEQLAAAQVGCLAVWLIQGCALCRTSHVAPVAAHPLASAQLIAAPIPSVWCATALASKVGGEGSCLPSDPAWCTVSSVQSPATTAA